MVHYGPRERGIFLGQRWFGSCLAVIRQPVMVQNKASLDAIYMLRRVT